MTSSQHVYEVRPRNDHRGVDLISDVLPFGRLWYGEPNAISNAIEDAKFYNRSHDAHQSGVTLKELQRVLVFIQAGKPQLNMFKIWRGQSKANGIFVG
jgi:hypothetical protein